MADLQDYNPYQSVKKEEQIQGNQNAVNQMTNNDTRHWFYLDNKNQRKGPFNSAELVQLINSYAIHEDTYISYVGAEQWIYVKDTEFKSYLNGGLPEIPITALNNKWAWALSSVQIISFILTTIKFDTTASWIICLLLNTLFFLLDSIEVTKIRKRSNLWVIWGIVIIPVYLFIRAYKMDKKYGYAITYISICLMSFLFGFIIAFI